MFDNVLFPLQVASMSSTIEFHTTILPADSGAESRNIDWDDALLTIDAASGVKDTDDLSTLIAFFYARKGAGRGFLVKDWADYKAASQGLGTRTGSATQVFQLVKSYGDSANTHTREITKPKQGTLIVRAGLSILTENTHYTVDYTTGLITVLAGQVTAGSVLTCDFEFYVPMRFSEDKLRTALLLYKLTHGLGEVEVILVETRDFQ